jgi:hypothetical protein
MCISLRISENGTAKHHVMVASIWMCQEVPEHVRPSRSVYALQNLLHVNGFGNSLSAKESIHEQTFTKIQRQPQHSASNQNDGWTHLRLEKGSL